MSQELGPEDFREQMLMILWSAHEDGGTKILGMRSEMEEALEQLIEDGMAVRDGEYVKLGPKALA